MSLAALAEDLNNANRLYQAGRIDFARFEFLVCLHNLFYQNEIKRRGHAQQL